MFYFQENSKQTKKPVNCFLQDDASAGIQSLQTSIEIKLPEPIERTIEFRYYFVLKRYRFLTATIFIGSASDCT